MVNYVTTYEQLKEERRRRKKEMQEYIFCFHFLINCCACKISFLSSFVHAKVFVFSFSDSPPLSHLHLNDGYVTISFRLCIPIKSILNEHTHTHIWTKRTIYVLVLILQGGRRMKPDEVFTRNSWQYNSKFIVCFVWLNCCLWLCTEWMDYLFFLQY